MSDRCFNCRYFDDRPHGQQPLCRYRAPYGACGYHYRFPAVLPEEWCGRFSRKTKRSLREILRSFWGGR